MASYHFRPDGIRLVSDPSTYIQTKRKGERERERETFVSPLPNLFVASPGDFFCYFQQENIVKDKRKGAAAAL
jgi:hypothetical protein